MLKEEETKVTYTKVQLDQGLQRENTEQNLRLMREKITEYLGYRVEYCTQVVELTNRLPDSQPHILYILSKLM